MVDTLRSAAELATTVAIGTVLGGTILRYFFLKWLKDREEFERETGKAIDTLRATMSAHRDENIAARQALKDHVDHEDRVLRDRYHDLSGIVQTVVAKIEVTDRRLGEVATDLKNLTKELHGLTVSLTTLTERLPHKG
jgi:oligoendopeptidase F